MPQNNNRSNLPNLERDNLSNNNISKTQKITSIILVIFGVFLIGFSFFQFKNKIVGPFRMENSENNNITQEEKINFHLAVLENMDTDEDSLSDYEELYIYNSSPYLEDTDSDGISDFEEIQRGSDPNCPEGEDCSISGSIQTPVDSVDNNEGYTDTFEENQNNSNTTGSIEDNLVDTITTGEVDVSVLRELMLANGFEKEELDQISDEDLEMMYIQSISEQGQEE